MNSAALYCYHASHDLLHHHCYHDLLQLIIPEEAPLADDVDYQKLAQFEMAGGNMKGAVFRAAARAALRDEGVGRGLEPLALHLLHAYSETHLTNYGVMTFVDLCTVSGPALIITADSYQNNIVPNLHSP